MMSPIPPPTDHGGDGPAIAAALGLDLRDVLDLSITLNPFAPDPAPLVASFAGAARFYPDLTAGERVLAGALGVESSRVVLTNGASEAIAVVAAARPVGRIDEPEFSLYQRHLTLDPEGPRWRSNPHNPSGRLAGIHEGAAVWDESFWPLATGTWTRGDADEGSIVIGSLTKLFACPGLRIGYVLAPDAETAAEVRRHRPEWSVNSMAVAALPRLLESADLTGWACRLQARRAELTDQLVRRGCEVESADAPWILVHSARGLRDHLANQGVVVRDCSSFGMTDTVRIAVPDTQGIERLLGAFEGCEPQQ